MNRKGHPQDARSEFNVAKKKENGNQTAKGNDGTASASGASASSASASNNMNTRMNMNMASPQAPRVMSVHERRRQIYLRRSSSSNGNGNIFGVKRKRGRTGVGVGTGASTNINTSTSISATKAKSIKSSTNHGSRPQGSYRNTNPFARKNQNVAAAAAAAAAKDGNENVISSNDNGNTPHADTNDSGSTLNMNSFQSASATASVITSGSRSTDTMASRKQQFNGTGTGTGTNQSQSQSQSLRSSTNTSSASASISTSATNTNTNLSICASSVLSTSQVLKGGGNIYGSGMTVRQQGDQSLPPQPRSKEENNQNKTSGDTLTTGHGHGQGHRHEHPNGLRNAPEEEPILFQSPVSNESKKAQLHTPSSSLFGEIMKRSDLKRFHPPILRTDEDEGEYEHDDEHNNNVNGNGGLLDLAVKRNGNGDNKGGDDKELESSSSSSSMMIPPRTSGNNTSSSFRFNSLVPSLVHPRRRSNNMFKQWSKLPKVSSQTDDHHQEIIPHESDYYKSPRPQRKPINLKPSARSQPLSIMKSPSKSSPSKSSPSKPSPSKPSPSREGGNIFTNTAKSILSSSFGTPVRASKRARYNSVGWDPETPTPTVHKGPLFRRSPKTPERGLALASATGAATAVSNLNHQTPERKRNGDIHVNWDPRTPDVQKKFHASPSSKTNNYLNSPGGFALRQFLDSCMSPFNKNADQGKMKSFNNMDELSAEGDIETSRSSMGTVDGLDEWRESWVHLPSFLKKSVFSHNGEIVKDSDFCRRQCGDVGFMDWSLKRALKIECHPDNCIPGTALHTLRRKGSTSAFSFQPPVDYDRIERLSMELFMDSKKLSCGELQSEKEEEEVVLAQWQAALMYWQHPANHPLPPALFPEQSGDSKKKKSSLTRSNSIDTSAFNNIKTQPGGSMLQRQLSLPATIAARSTSVPKQGFFAPTKGDKNITAMFDSATGPNAPLRQSFTRAGVGTLGGLGESDTEAKHLATVSAMLEQRKSEWQDCLRSLFLNWLHRVYELREKYSNLSTLDMDVSDLDGLSRLYFYSLSPGCSILTRVATSSKEGNDENEMNIEPMIILSSSTVASRSAMRSLNILFTTMNSSDSDDTKWTTEATEELIDQWFELNEDKDDIQSYKLRHELEALRRATAHESVGAEVSILHQRKKKTEEFHPSIRKPLVIRGHDNCNAFFELYLNTTGRLVNDEIDASPQIDVPLLISRSISAKNMTIRKLAVSLHRDQKDVSAQDQPSSVDLNGPILPCAMRDLFIASSTHFTLHKKFSEGYKMGAANIPPNDTNENILGSHYFIAHPRVHKGQEMSKVISRLTTGSRKCGSSSSVWFNGISHALLSGYHEAEDEIKCENTNGEVTIMAVWDINRPQSIALKSSQVDELI